MFNKILIANRGEIACRVIRTARRLGIRTVAVYSEADANARHVAMADEAHLIGGAPARESYLKGEAILEAARKSNAEAIHPGYGFLSENAEFAQACAAAKRIFIGPPPAAIRAMGGKSAAKALMEQAGVPIVPGYHGDRQDVKTLGAAARKIGYPVLIKASAGGGGKGMRIVHAERELAEAIVSARREAKSAFGDDRLLIEKYLTRPRHIEVQVFADAHGGSIYLFERDCSIQRRHQKVLEEAPAPGMTEARRKAMGEAAVKAAKAVGYVGAGTVEFIAEPDGRFYFMEMNTRLQVEHPVTEMITGLDLVEWQFRVGAGQRLPLRQTELAINGHAIEARIYAEDPARDFLPATGMLQHLRFPAESAHVRVDTGVGPGDVVSIHYDPMIAKLIVWDHDRPAALRRLRAALADCEVAGLATNLTFLGNVAAHPAYAAAELDTGFIGRHRAELVPEHRPADDRTLALAALAVLLDRAAEAETAARSSHDPYSPWHMVNGWRLNDYAHHVLRFRDPLAPAAREVTLTAHFRRNGFVFDLPGGALAVRGDRLDATRIAADLGGARLEATVVRRGDELTVVQAGRAHRLILHRPLAEAKHAGEDGRLTAPMPGKIVAVKVVRGAKVKRGAALLVLEAMKMEHTISAPTDGTVAALRYGVGEQVEEGAALIEFKPETSE
ncbi:MAG TPA: acetyl/propionyl/methylcrotonyl-CoA carboxylase subunit alpha [Alphaproteobacteria bacterium]|nr:acetyl/propionyl/methylcrotonyl-CoA carboxylase subunit alpha [Alphaproteobacteria bacterium]